MISTVFFYNAIVMVSTLFVYLGEKGRTQADRLVLLGVAFLIVFVPAAIRYDIGTDFISYIHIYNNIDMYQGAIEPGYYWLNKILRDFDATPQWIMVVTSFIFTFSAFKGHSRNNRWVTHLVFFSLIYFFSFNGIRQAIAIAFTLWGLRLYLENRNWHFFILIFIASLFHYSALVWLPIILLAKIPLPQKFQFYVAPLIMIGIMAASFVSPFLIEFIHTVLVAIGSDYARYFSGIFFVPTDLGTGLGVLAMLSFSSWFLLNTKSFVKMDSKNWLIILLVFSFGVSQVLSAQIWIFGRLKEIFSAPLPFAVLLLWETHGSMRKLCRIVAVLLVIFLLLSFFKSSFGIPHGMGDPKRNPYQSYFFSPGNLDSI